jgi:hypothetical protein
MPYKPNPKFAGSNIVGAIPQKGPCPMKCPDCFFNTRSYLYPLSENLPNLPSLEETRGKIVRVNDGNDSNVDRELVIESTKEYEHAFFNTAIPRDLEGFGRPVILTANPAKKTDVSAYLLDPIPVNLMSVRFRVNTWNIHVCDKVVEHYTKVSIPVFLTFMAYYLEVVPAGHEQNYAVQRRTINEYNAITKEARARIQARYASNPLVLTCGTSVTDCLCKECGNCELAYWECLKRM